LLISASDSSAGDVKQANGLGLALGINVSFDGIRHRLRDHPAIMMIEAGGAADGDTAEFGGIDFHGRPAGTMIIYMHYIRITSRIPLNHDLILLFESHEADADDIQLAKRHYYRG
jgi:hypothetical protein